MNSRFFAATSVALLCAASPYATTLPFTTAVREGDPEVLSEQSQFAVGKPDVQRDNVFHRIVIEGNYTGTDGKPIRFKRYEKLGQDKAFLIWIDGMGGFIEQQEALFTSANEFPGGFSPFAETLADLPITVLTLDLPGQGASAAGRVPQHVESFDAFVAEVRQLIALFPDVNTHKRPIYLMGYSYGAVLAGRFAKAYPDLVDGVIMVSPTFVLKVPPQYEPATIELLETLATVYTLPPPNGLGLGNRCALAVSPQITGALAQCLQNGPCAACVQDPSLPHCAGIPLDFTVLQETWAWLQSPASIGCAWVPPPAEEACTFPSPSFNGLTTDYDYCAWALRHPLKAGTPLHGTFGNYFAMTTAGRQLLADPSHLEGKPVLVLSTPLDPLVDVTRHAEFCEKLSTCTLAVVPPAPPDFFYFHALLMEKDRASVIARIRDFLHL
jgi:alpha-beta hydrolase superfamily lysophospholipase